MNINFLRIATFKNYFIGIFLLFLLAYTSACKKEANHQTIPNVVVDIYVDVTSTIYMELSIVSGHTFLTGGYKGIVVYRLSESEFVAYDRACSYDPTNSCRLVFEQNQLNLVDTCCGSKFIIIDGSVQNGPATMSLKQYKTTFDGTNLHIFN